MNKSYLIKSAVAIIAIIIFGLGYLYTSKEVIRPSNVSAIEKERVCEKLKQAEAYGDTTAEYETINLFEDGQLVNCLVITSQGIEWVF